VCAYSHEGRAESVWGIEEITGNGPGGETGVEPGVGSDD
jgi:hypothetical protein